MYWGVSIYSAVVQYMDESKRKAENMATRRSMILPRMAYFSMEMESKRTADHSAPVASRHFATPGPQCPIPS